MCLNACLLAIYNETKKKNPPFSPHYNQLKAMVISRTCYTIGIHSKVTGWTSSGKQMGYRIAMVVTRTCCTIGIHSKAACESSSGEWLPQA
jgi:hypothetical protein